LRNLKLDPRNGGLAVLAFKSFDEFADRDHVQGGLFWRAK
jgi:hypothetical protein